MGLEDDLDGYPTTSKEACDFSEVSPDFAEDNIQIFYANKNALNKITPGSHIKCFGSLYLVSKKKPEVTDVGFPYATTTASIVEGYTPKKFSFVEDSKIIN